MNRTTHSHVLLYENNFTADGLQIFTNNLWTTYVLITYVVASIYHAHKLALRAHCYIEGGEPVIHQTVDLLVAGAAQGRGIRRSNHFRVSKRM
ncbi:hypothetical protein Ddye_023456 [Dipteronia dyeriana]|uniref:Uncharacterized protein n=1 Tax=Dipteronia dyeriana TaxID=168575 RepID=A0AAD9TTZ6_9ROSI|nr:hypothetical protein Ddye_023456 [Dipteronia dyeriana]